MLLPQSPMCRMTEINRGVLGLLACYERNPYLHPERLLHAEIPVQLRRELQRFVFRSLMVEPRLIFDISCLRNQSEGEKVSES